MSTFVVYPTAEQEKAVEDFLESQNVSFDKEEESVELPQHVLDGIKRGQEDFKAGRFISYEEFKKRQVYSKPL
ncbi:hypothetical protein [Mucilaginibacter ginkgonis]|uniref:Uncharacterized protein n=1 Tax=Mucilaginibacter ginkgonis TaxID=2682091 RepID=A0A6I4I199_9SPHI|nr:hypothetical protein [Mucilaginibacter ginkgonis]QQL48543.1 hypothetical protein GO620_010100 [Mucilaginibacter ginkgonis]